MDFREVPFWRRYLRLFGPDPKGDAGDEIAFHLEETARELIESGMDEAAARAEARRRFGDVEARRREMTAIGERRALRARVADAFDRLRQDIAYALRQLAARPAFTLGTTAILALGIGANATVFSLVDALLLRPLTGIPEPERLVTGWFSVAHPEFEDFREAGKGLVDLAAFSRRTVAYRTCEGTEVARALVVTGPYFQVVGVRVVLGRALTADDDRPGADPVAVVTAGFWRRSMGSDPSVLGRTIVLNGAPVAVVGVADPEFRGTRIGSAPEILLTARAWKTMAPSYFGRLDIDSRSWGWLTLIGRLAPGVSQDRVEAALLASAASQRQLFADGGPPDDRARLYAAVPAAVGVDGRKPIVGFAAVLAGVAALVLLIACANVANLLLARAAERRREMAVRAALGASRGRLLRQLLTESLVLSFLGGLAAASFVAAGARALRSVTLPGGLELASLDLGPGAAVLGVTSLLALATGLLFGLVPAWHASRESFGIALKESAPTDTPERARTRRLLLAFQVALCLVLLIGAGLFTRALERALDTDLGFDPSGVGIAFVDPGLARARPAREAAFFRESESRALSIPGVTSAAWSFRVPLTDGIDTNTVQIPGYVPAKDENPEVEVNSVGPGWLATIGGRLAAGRFFEAGDRDGAPAVAVINEAMARRYWAGRDPLGLPLDIMGKRCTVIGVARDARYGGPDQEAAPLVFLSFAQSLANAGGGQRALTVRAARDIGPVLAELRAAVRAAGPEFPVRRMGSFEEVFGALLLPQRAGAGVLWLFSLLATIVAAFGVAGMVANSVARRTREIGIRLALGATAGHLVRLVAGGTLVTIAAGVALGLILAALLTPAAAGFLFGVSARDVVTFGGTSLLFVAIGGVAALIPARRVLKIDPIRALRAE